MPVTVLVATLDLVQGSRPIFFNMILAFLSVKRMNHVSFLNHGYFTKEGKRVEILT